MKTSKTPKQVMQKEILSAEDVSEFFDNQIRRDKALKIIKDVNQASNRFNIRGKCSAVDFIAYFKLNPKDYGRAPIVEKTYKPIESGQTSDRLEVTQ